MYNHVALPVVSLSESHAFYEALGFEKLRTWQKSDQQIEALVMQNKDGFILELVHHPDNRLLERSHIIAANHIGLSVTNLHKTLEE